MIARLRFLVLTTAFQLLIAGSTVLKFQDDLLGLMESQTALPPFLVSALFPQGPLVYPNTRQIRQMPGHSIFDVKQPNYTAESRAYFGYLGRFLTASFPRAPFATAPNGTRIEDQFYSFKAMIVSNDNWQSLVDSLVEVQNEREIAAKEVEEIKQRSTTEPPTTTTTRLTMPPQKVRPRGGRRRWHRSITLPTQSYEEIPLLDKVAYPITEITHELSRCEQNEEIEMNGNIFKHRGDTKIKLLNGGGVYMGVAIYRVTCRRMSATQTFVAIGLQRIVYETTEQSANALASEAGMEKMIAYGRALLNEHIYDNYYFPYIRNLATYPTLKPYSPPDVAEIGTEAARLHPTTEANKRELDTSVSTFAGIDYDDIEAEDMDDREDTALSNSALIDNRVPKAPKRSTPAAIRSRQIRALVSRNVERVFDEYMDKWDNITEEQTRKGSCRLEAHDICIVMDESGSIGAADFHLAKKFVADLTRELRIGPGEYESRVSVVKFSTSASVAFKLNAHFSNDGAYNAIMALAYNDGGTNIASGMNTAINQIFTRPEGKRLFVSTDGDRSWIPNMIIVMTDGQDGSDVEGARMSAQQKNISVTAVGIGSGVNIAQLTKIADIADHVHKVSNFAHLDNDFIKKLCAPLDDGMDEEVKVEWIEPEMISSAEARQELEVDEIVI